MLGARVGQEARAGQEAKAGREAKAGSATGVGATVEARRVMCGARAGSGGPSHEAAVLKGGMEKTKRERGAPAPALAAVLTSVII